MASAPVQKPQLTVVPLPLPPPTRRWLRSWMLWVAPLVLALIAILWWRTHVSAQIGFETVPVEAGSVQALVTATGTLNPVVNVQVGSQVSGNIKALYADFNTKVKKGQLVALIDPDIFQAQVDQAEAAAASASSAVVTAGAQIEKAQSDVSGSRANRDNLLALAAKDRANFINAKMEWQRADMLFRNRVYSAEQHDSAKAAYDSAQAQLAADQSQIDAANHNIQSAEAQVRVAQTQLATARAQQRQAEATLVQTKINLKHTRIVAPVSGTVIARHFDVGQTVAASFQAPDIFDIAQDLTRMQVDTNVDESDVGDIRNGQPVTFTVDAYPGTIFRGAVSDVRKAPISAQNVVTYDVVINLSNPDLKLFPGMTANVSIETAREDNALKVANAALRFHPTSELASRQKLPALVPGSPQLYVLSGSKITLVPVECGITDGKFTVVSGSQLKSGDQAIVRAITANSSNATTQTTPTPRLPRM